jgi:hypothetical protein
MFCLRRPVSARAFSQRAQDLGEYKAAHGPGCGCCSTKPSRLVKQTKSGAKSFPTARPWMISH